VTEPRRPLRIAIYADFEPGRLGGIEQFTIGLVSALGKLTDGDEEYLVIAAPGKEAWIAPYLGPNQTLVTLPEKPLPVDNAKGSGIRHILRGVWHSVPAPIRQWIYEVRLGKDHGRSAGPVVPTSDGRLESLEPDVVLFTYQLHFSTRILSVYCPHDLQHIHLPQNFTLSERAMRNVFYRSGCENAAAVVTPSKWGRDDVIRQYGVPGSRVFSVRHGAPTELYRPADAVLLADVRRKYDLPDKFAFFPAQTWAHKNHIRLFEALASAIERGASDLHIVCSGKLNDHYSEIQKFVRGAQLENRVHFLGYVDQDDLRSLYALAEFVIYPSLFEGGGMPLLEAFHEGVAVASSNVTSLPEYGGDAVFSFDPTSTESIADALVTMHTDADLRDRLVDRGRRLLAEFQWREAALQYRAIFRHIAGVSLTEYDRAFIGGNEAGHDLTAS